jgi:hypothetical protein
MNKIQFGGAMRAILYSMGGSHLKSDKQIYVGCRIKPHFAHRISQLTSPAGEPKYQEPRRLGQFGQDRRALVATGEVAGTA